SDSLPDPSSALLLAAAAAADDQPVGLLALAPGALAERRHPPGRDRVAAALRLPLAAAVRMVDRVHRRAAHGGAPAKPAAAARLADADVRVLHVPDLSDRGAAAERDTAELARGKPQHRVRLVLGDELDAGAGRAPELAAPARLQLDVVHQGAGGDALERQRVARLDVRFPTRLDDRADLQPRRREDVRLGAVRVVQEGDARRAVRVVFDRGHLRGHAVLAPLEVDDAVAALVAAAAVARRHAAVHVPPGLLRQRLGQALLGLRPRHLVEGGDRHEPASCARRLVLANRHRRRLLDLRSLEDRDRLSLAHLDDRLLVAGPVPLRVAAALGLRLHLRHVHARYVHGEQLLDRLPDLGLVRVAVHAERVLAVADQAVALLGDDRRDQDLVRVQAHDVSSPLPGPPRCPFPARAATSGSADSLTRSDRAHTTAATSSSSGVVTATWARFRNDFSAVSSSPVTTTTSGSSLPQAPTSAAACLVDGSAKPPASNTANVPSATCAESAPRRAALFSLRLTLKAKLRIVGGKATPPPVQCGARVVPMRARPVPF